MRGMLKNPGAWLVLMAWWIVPFLVIALFSYPVRDYASSYVPFLIAFVVILSSGTLMNTLERKFQFWGQLRHWGKYLVLTGSYALAVFVVLIITITLSSYRLVGYFGGDPEGSFGMLYLPSVIFYFVAGAFASVVLTAKDFLRKRRT